MTFGCFISYRNLDKPPPENHPYTILVPIKSTCAVLRLWPHNASECLAKSDKSCREELQRHLSAPGSFTGAPRSLAATFSSWSSFLRVPTSGSFDWSATARRIALRSLAALGKSVIFHAVRKSQRTLMVCPISPQLEHLTLDQSLGSGQSREKCPCFSQLRHVTVSGLRGWSQSFAM